MAKNTASPLAKTQTLIAPMIGNGGEWVRAASLAFVAVNADPGAGNVNDFNLYRYVRNSPLLHTDPTGLITVGEWGRCGEVEMRYNFGEKKTTSVFPNSTIASIMLMGGSGCVTLPSGIYCTGTCNEILTWKSSDNPAKTILEHEACHYCALVDYGYCAYLKTAGAAPDGCVGHEMPAKPIWGPRK
ncbi:MAG: hypothetical protein HUU20_25270 [Pirellulales bacterium]|nr:hypothetical protein [Pirellulales bacterium]